MSEQLDLKSAINLKSPDNARRMELNDRDVVQFAGLGLVVLLAFSREQLLATPSEYITFYNGARLLGTPYLYDAAHGYLHQIAALGGFTDQFLFVRIPFCALLHWPLSLLTYGAARHVWSAISAVALAGFIWLWKTPNWKVNLVACCWSLPILFDFVFGKDTVFLLLLLAIAFRLYQRRPAVSGLIMSVLAVKFHLFLLLPLLFLGQRRWRMAAGFSLGAAVIASVSFLVGGPDWPVRLVRLILSQSTSREHLMPNLRGLIAPFSGALLPELLMAAGVAVLTWRIVCHSDFEYGLSAVLLASLLVSHHTAIYDCALLLPAILVVSGRAAPQSALSFLCLFLLTPVPYILLTIGVLPAMISRFALIALLVCLHAGRPTDRLLERRLTPAQIM